MIEPIEGTPEGVLAFRAVGKVEAADYASVLTPAIEAAVGEHGRVRLVYELRPRFDGYSAGAAWEDMKLWAPHLRSWDSGDEYGAFMEPSGRNRWQAVANGTVPKVARTSENRCHKLRPVAAEP